MGGGLRRYNFKCVPELPLWKIQLIKQVTPQKGGTASDTTKGSGSHLVTAKSTWSNYKLRYGVKAVVSLQG